MDHISYKLWEAINMFQQHKGSKMKLSANDALIENSKKNFIVNTSLFRVRCLPFKMSYKCHKPCVQHTPSIVNPTFLSSYLTLEVVGIAVGFQLYI